MCVLFIPTGSLFAFLSFVESLTTNTSIAVFNSVYSATVAWYPTFVFMLAATLCVIPLIVLGYVYHAFQCREENHLFVCHLIPELFYKAFTWWIRLCFCVKKSGAAALVCRQLTKPVLQGRCSKSVLYFQEINTEDFFFLLLQHLQRKNLSFCHLTVVYSDFYQTRGKKCWPEA